MLKLFGSVHVCMCVIISIVWLTLLNMSHIVVVCNLEEVSCANIAVSCDYHMMSSHPSLFLMIKDLFASFSFPFKATLIISCVICVHVFRIQSSH